MSKSSYRYFIFSCFEWSLSVTLLLAISALFFVIANGKIAFWPGLGLLLSLEALYFLSAYEAIMTMRHWCVTCHRDVGVDEEGVKRRMLFVVPLTRCRACHTKFLNDNDREASDDR